jgi:hypothetical protein
MATGDEPVPDETSETGETATPEAPPAEKEQSMEIHPIHGPVHSLRDFFVHLSIITIGILIALSLESLVEWRHNHSLAREARVNLAIEIRNNKETVDRAVTEIQTRKEGLKKIIAAMKTLEAGKPGPKDLNYTFIGYDLYSTAWATAANSGATAHMDYPELKRYTDLYNMQQIFMNLQFDAFRATADISDLGAVLDRDPKTVSKNRFEQIETAAARYLTILVAQEDAAQQLSKKYGAFEHN